METETRPKKLCLASCVETEPLTETNLALNNRSFKRESFKAALEAKHYVDSLQYSRNGP